MIATGEGKGRRVLAALADLARASVRAPTPVQLDSSLRALRSRMVSDEAGQRSLQVRRAVRRWSVAATVAATSALAAVLVLRFGQPRGPEPSPPLSYRVEGGNVVEGGYLRESGRSGIKLFFAEGTEFRLTPGTRSRLRAVDASGARIAIEQGTASFQVTPAPANDRRWQVDVGPFLVTVKGTVFTVSWDAASEKFELRLRHGRVTVSGPITGGEIALRAGQRLLVDLPRGETVINEQAPQAAKDDTNDDSKDDSNEAPAGPRANDPPAERASAAVDKAVRPMTRLPAGEPADRRWPEALAAGHLDRILAEAERAGVKSTLERAPSDDLLALADAARYRRRMELARETLLAERRRFPDSPRSLDAAFLLGRVEEASDSGLQRAIEWYDEYLKRAPAGTYASEALGRKMTLTSRLEGASAARPIAEAYLRRFPGGTYAGPARAFLRGP